MDVGAQRHFVRVETADESELVNADRHALVDFELLRRCCLIVPRLTGDRTKSGLVADLTANAEEAEPSFSCQRLIILHFLSLLKAFLLHIGFRIGALGIQHPDNWAPIAANDLRGMYIR